MPPPSPLSELERASLRRALNRSEHTMSYEAARGAFAALATMPEMVPPSSWFELVLGENALGGLADARDVVGKLLRLYNEVLEQVSQVAPAACPSPDDADAVSDWADGYLSATAFDDRFEDDTTRPVLAALSVLSEPGVAPELDAEKLQALRAKLPELVTMLYLYFKPIRMAVALDAQERASARSKPAQAAAKTGRNDPCPCGSGKKFKRCCAV